MSFLDGQLELPRWWHAVGDELTLRDGMLPRPDLGFNAYLNQRLRRLDQTEQLRARVLLADPGMGKSAELRREAARLEAAGDHVAFVELGEYTTSSEIQEAIGGIAETWRAAGEPGELVLAFDGFDEPLVDLRNLGDVLLRAMDRLDRGRLRVLVASRGSQWSSAVGERFVSWWGAEQVETMMLAPLSAEDVAAAALSEGVDPDAFLAAVSAASAGPLAARPLTLRLLLAAAGEGELPSSRLGVYRTGVRGLAAEGNPRRVDQRRTGRPTGERLAAARRLAAVSLLTGRTRIVRRSTPAQVPGVLALDDVDGAALEALDEVWDGALMAGGSDVRTWSHLSLAEYLAAEHLATLPVETAWSLLAAPGDPSRLRPQFEETAGWTASLSDPMFDRLVDSRPRLLLNGDLTSRPPADAERVGRAVMGRVRHDDPTLTHDEMSYLQYPDLANDLHDLLATSQPHWRRRIAISIISATALRDLDDELLTIVHAAGTPATNNNAVTLAAAAIYALTGTDNAAVRHELRSMIGDAALPEYVRATIITHLGPNALTPDDLLTLVSPQDRFSGVVGRAALELMLEGTRTGVLRPAAAIRWLEQPTDAALHQDRTRALAAAAAYDAVREGPTGTDWQTAVGVVSWLTRGPSQLSEWTAEQVGSLGVSLRRELAQALLQGRRDEWLASALASAGLLPAEDLLWWLEQLAAARAGSGDHGLSAGVAVAALLDVVLDDAGILATARDLCATSPLLAEISQQLDDASVATRRHHRDQAATRRRDRDRAEALSRFSQQRLDLALESLDREAALQELSRSPARGERPIGPRGPLPGWVAATSEARDRTARMLADLLASDEPDLDSFEEVALLAESVAVVAFHDEALLEGVPAGRWPQWLRPLLRSHRGDSGRIALQRALAVDVTAVEVALQALVDDSPLRGAMFLHRWVLDALPEPVLRGLAARSLEHAGQPDVEPDRLADLLAVGTAGLPVDALPVAFGHLAGRPVSAPTGVRRVDDPATAAWRRAVVSLKALIANPQIHSQFDDLLAAFLDAPELAIEAVNTRGPWEIRDSWAGLSSDQIGRLYLWARTAMPSPQHTPGVTVHAPRAEEVPDDLIGLLLRRADIDSAGVLEHLADQTGNVWLRAEAERIRTAVAADVVPPSPEAVLAVFEDPARRAVTTGAQLAQVVLAELDEIAAQVLRDRGLRGTFWERQRNNTRWAGTYVPPEENDFSDRLTAQLELRLRKRVALLREVLLQPGLSDVGGDFPDIYAISLKTDNASVRLPIEVKGNWHRQVVTALRSQLADRYLSGDAGTEGIYVVGYYHGDKWAPTDKLRRAAATRRSIEKLRVELGAKAAAAAARGRTVHVRVLDIPLDLPGGDSGPSEVQAGGQGS